MTTLICPLCSQSRFETLESLKVRLVTAATQNITCPICNDSLMGLDKFTIHLFGHTLHQQHPELPEPPVIPEHHRQELLDSLCTVNIEDLNCLTSWEACTKGNRSESTQTEEERVIEQKNQFTKQEITFPPARKLDEDIFTKQSQAQYSFSSLEKQTRPEVHTTEQYSNNQLNQIREAYDIKEEPIPHATVSIPIHVQQTHPKSPHGKEDSVHEMFVRFQNITPPHQLTLELQPGYLEPLIKTPSPLSIQTDNDSGSNIFFQQRTNQLLFSHDPTDIFNRRTSMDHILSPYKPFESSKQHRDVCCDDSSSPDVKQQDSPDSQSVEDTTDNKDLSEYMSELLKQKLSAPNLFFPLVKKTRKCDICNVELDNADLLMTHKELVHCGQTDGFSCKLCGKGFKMRGSLLVHNRVAHGGSGADPVHDYHNQQDRNFHCVVCSKSFKKESHLSQHIKTHDGKQWQCETCSKYFTTKYFLKKHQRLHTGEMPYCCGTCKKTFTFQQSYHKHLLYHSADKPHECQECGRAFKELSTLHNHQRIHSGEKPFACETCGKCFRQRVSYIVHQRIHTGVLPYQCTACKKKFRYKVSQRSHKCSAQPPGVVVRQPGHLIQRIMEQRQNILQCTE